MHNLTKTATLGWWEPQTRQLQRMMHLGLLFRATGFDRLMYSFLHQCFLTFKQWAHCAVLSPWSCKEMGIWRENQRIEESLSRLLPQPSQPDITVWDQVSITLIEVAVTFKLCIESVVHRKMHRYSDLLDECRANCYTAELLTLEAGSRGLLHCRSFEIPYELVVITSTGLCANVLSSSKVGWAPEYEEAIAILLSTLLDLMQTTSDLLRSAIMAVHGSWSLKPTSYALYIALMTILIASTDMQLKQ